MGNGKPFKCSIDDLPFTGCKIYQIPPFTRLRAAAEIMNLTKTKPNNWLQEPGITWEFWRQWNGLKLKVVLPWSLTKGKVWTLKSALRDLRKYSHIVLNKLRHVIFLFFFLHSSLLAVSLDDFEIQVVDIDMRRIVRIFRGHTNRITDLVSGDINDRTVLWLSNG